MKKKIVSIVLALVLILSIGAVPAFAASEGNPAVLAVNSVQPRLSTYCSNCHQMINSFVDSEKVIGTRDTGTQIIAGVKYITYTQIWQRVERCPACGYVWTSTYEKGLFTRPA